VLDPDRKKMSKTKGNVVTPLPLLESYGPDALRYWSSSGRPGVDTAVDENQMKVGRRLAIKLLNASKFVLDRIAGLPEGQLGNLAPLVTTPLDLSMLAYLAERIDAATKSFDEFDYAKALEITENFFWDFCDDYLELVKIRSYGDVHAEETLSALSSLGIALSSILRLFAPFLPFAAEEAWSWWHDGSIHLSPWPETSSLPALCKNTDTELFKTASALLTTVRRHKSNNKVSMRAEVASIHILAPQALIDVLPKIEGDLKAAGNIDRVSTDAGDELSVDVVLKD
jgi:valyl-tRNA synthetase